MRQENAGVLTHVVLGKVQVTAPSLTKEGQPCAERLLMRLATVQETMS